MAIKTIPPINGPRLSLGVLGSTSFSSAMGSLFSCHKLYHCFKNGRHVRSQIRQSFAIKVHILKLHLMNKCTVRHITKFLERVVDAHNPNRAIDTLFLPTTTYFILKRVQPGLMRASNMSAPTGDVTLGK